MLKFDKFDLNHGEISVKKVFWLLVSFEIFCLFTMYFGDRIFYNDPFLYLGIAGIVVLPFLFLSLPIEPVIGISLMVLTTGLDYLGKIAEGPRSINFNLTYFHFALLITFISMFMNQILRSRITFKPAGLWPSFIVYLMIISISTIYTPDFADGSFLVVKMIVMGFIALIVIESVDKKWKIQFLTWSMIIIPVGISFLTLYQLITEGAFYSSKVVKMATSLGLAVYRSTGTFDNPNKLACFLMIGIVMSFGMMFAKKRSKLEYSVLVVSLIVCSAGILSTFSRAGWISTFAGLFLIVAFHRKWSYIVYFMILVFVVMLVVTIYKPQMMDMVIDRFNSLLDPTGDDSSSARISLIKTGVWMWQDNPIFGVGLRGFPKLYYDYVDPNMPNMLIEVNEPHTMQVEILAEEGLVGFFIVTWFFMTILFHGVRSFFKMKDNYLRCIQVSATALFVGFLVNFTFATDIVNNIFWITIGFIYAISFVDNSESEDNPELSDNIGAIPEK